MPEISEGRVQPPATAGGTDCIIVGAGPAGSSMAIRLALAGRRVVLVEKAKFPREKLCGEFISPECFSHFDELGVSAAMVNDGGSDLIQTVFYGRNGKGAAVESEWFGGTSAAALGLSRAEMDHRLLGRAAEVGVEIIEGATASGLIFENDSVSGVSIRDKERSETTIEARIVIDATGRGRALTRFLVGTQAASPRVNGAGTRGLAARVPTAAGFVAFKTHIKGAKVADDTCEIYSYRGGYGGCNRVEGGFHNLCFIASARDVKRNASDPERVLREVVFTNRRAEETLRDATVATPWLAVPIERYGRGELVPANGLICIGDAAAFIDPFTGSGILMALESGKIAAEAIVENSGSFDAIAHAYRARYAAKFDGRLRMTSLLRRVAFVPFAAELTVAALTVSSGFRRRIARATR